MSSIADKFKKLLPVSNGNDKARVDGSGSISLDDVDTVQVPDEKTVRLARKGESSSPVSPAPTGFGDVEGLADGQTPDALDAAALEAVPPAGRTGSNPARQQRILAIMLAVVVLLLLLVAGSAILRSERLAQQVAATGQSLMQSQRLAKSISQALVGSASAFVEVKDSACLLYTSPSPRDS